MYARTEYEMSEADLEKLLDACKSTPVMMIGGFALSTPQDNANRAWRALGKKLGFDGDSVRPVSGKGNRFFTAIPSETDEGRKERLAREAEEKRLKEIARLETEIGERQTQLAALKV